jgi:hypothetical protein
MCFGTGMLKHVLILCFQKEHCLQQSTYMVVDPFADWCGTDLHVWVMNQNSHTNEYAEQQMWCVPTDYVHQALFTAASGVRLY